MGKEINMAARKVIDLTPENCAICKWSIILGLHEIKKD